MLLSCCHACTASDQKLEMDWNVERLAVCKVQGSKAREGERTNRERKGKEN